MATSEICPFYNYETNVDRRFQNVTDIAKRGGNTFELMETDLFFHVGTLSLVRKERRIQENLKIQV